MRAHLRLCSLAILSVIISSTISFGAIGDTLVVPVYQNDVVVTNPGTGSNPYYRWGVFPDSSVTYNKVIMYLTFQCPDNMNCAEWDYLDPISIGRPAGANSTALNWEFARFITPYGNSWGAGSNFKHGWYYDVTDFAGFLHDSVEIIYNHTGYETNTVGWKINMTFYLVEGTPEREVKKVSPLYAGGFAYNSNIETALSAQSFTYENNTNAARVKIIQSGHGMNDDNCSEFCPKMRYVKYDNNTINTKLMWRECGFNSLYPQAGTWLYDRGNWCPGASVRYDDIELDNVAPGGAHTIDIDMEAVSSGNYGNQAITAYLVEYGQSAFSNDVSLEGIIAPSKEYESLRYNPVCGSPIIVIRNNKATPLTSLAIDYGVVGGTPGTFQWTGNLAYLEADTVTINQPVNWVPGANMFRVELKEPNGTADDYQYNNIAHSLFDTVIAFPSETMIIYFQTNNAPSENHYILTDLTTGTVVSEKLNFPNANTVYKDTITLVPSHCYDFRFYDDGPPPTSNPLNNDGLGWWANPDDGTGILRLYKGTTSTIIKSFPPDFGTKILYQFTCKATLSVAEVGGTDISVTVAPNPSINGVFNISYNLPEANSELEVYNILGMKVYSQKLQDVTGDEQVSLSELSKGIYIIKIRTAEKVVHTGKLIYQ